MNAPADPLAAPGRTPLSRCVVIGVGGGGCNALARMSAGWADGPELVAINTDAQALAACPVSRKVEIGRNVTQGFGAGGDLALGKLAAEDSADKLRNLFIARDLVVLVVTLGGGTGTGAAPILAGLARQEGALTICIATLPFEYEGERRRAQADEGLRLLKTGTDAVVCLPNQRLFELTPDRASLAGAFEAADRMLGVGVRSLWKLLFQNGIINLDFADLRNLVEHGGGACIFGYAEASGSDRASKVAAELLKSPLLDRGQALERSPAVLVSVTGGPDLALLDIQRIMKSVKASVRADARLAMGALVDENWVNRVAVTVFAADDSETAPTPARAPAARARDTHAGGTDAGKKDTAAGVEDTRKIRRPTREVQPELVFDGAGDKGRFKGVDPTIYEGEDLDIPTFIRRGIKIGMD